MAQEAQELGRPTEAQVKAVAKAIRWALPDVNQAQLEVEAHGILAALRAAGVTAVQEDDDSYEYAHSFRGVDPQVNTRNFCFAMRERHGDTVWRRIKAGEWEKVE